MIIIKETDDLPHTQYTTTRVNVEYDYGESERTPSMTDEGDDEIIYRDSDDEEEIDKEDYSEIDSNLIPPDQIDPPKNLSEILDNSDEDYDDFDKEDDDYEELGKKRRRRKSKRAMPLKSVNTNKSQSII